MEIPASGSHPPQQTAKPKARWSGRRRLLVLLLGLGLFTLGLRAVLPGLVERGAAWASRRYLGLPACIDNVDFSLFKGIVSLEGVSVGAAPDGVAPLDAAIHVPSIDPSTAFLHFGKITLRLSWRDLFKKSLHFSEITVEAPTVRLQRESDGLIDPLRNAKPQSPLSASAPPSTAKSSGEPWAFEINRFAIHSPNLVITDRTNSRSLLDFSLESFDLDNITAKGSEIALGAMGIQGPVLRVRKNLVLDENPASPPAAHPPSATQNSPASPQGYRIKKIDIVRAKFTWVTDDGPLDVQLTLKASGITADQGKKFPLELGLQIADGTISLTGDAGILPPSFRGKFAWQGLPFPPLLLASLPKLAAWLQSADSSGDLSVETDLEGLKGPPALRLSGRTTIKRLAVADPGGQEFSLGWNQLEVVMGDMFVPVPEPDKPLPTTRLHFEHVRLVDPVIRYTHPAPALNALLGIPSANSPTGSAPAASASPPVDVRVGQLDLVNGNIEIHDTTVKPAATSTVRDLAVSATAFHFPDPSAGALKIEATLPQAARLAITGTLQPGNVGDYSLSLQELDLPTFNSYAVAAGASLDAGRVSLETKLKTQGVSLQVENDVVLKKIGVSLRDPDSFNREFGMPIDLAIALMSDPAGDIKLKIPLRVDEKGTTIALGTVIGSALRAALLGAVTAPLKLLGASFGAAKSGAAGASLSISPITCTAGGADPGADAPARADGLVKLLAERPSMGLLLRGRTSTADHPFIAEQILIERLNARQGLPEIDGVGFLARHHISQVLSKRGKGKKENLSAKNQELLNKFLAAVDIPKDRLDNLAKSRAEKVRDLLVARKVPAKRIGIGDREADGEPGVLLSFRKQ